MVWLTLSIAIPLQLAATFAGLAYCTPRPQVATYWVTTTEHAPVIIPFTTPILSTVAASPPPRERGPRASCPPPRTEAPRLTPPELPEDVTHVRPSVTNAGWIAAWNDEHVYVSTNAGSSFTRVLDGPGGVRDVDFDCHGRAIAVRGELVGVRASSREHWRALPGLGLADRRYPDSDYVHVPDVFILGGGPDVVIAGHAAATDANGARVAISEDLGDSWRYHDLHDYVEGPMIGRQREDGRIDVGAIVVDCMSEDLLWVRISDGKVDPVMRWIQGMSASLRDDIALSRNQWQRRGSDDWKPILGLEEAEDPVALEDSSIILDGATAYRVKRGRAHALPWTIEGNEHAADPAGRIWSVVCGQPWIARRAASGRSCPE
jgi:hypothetical protein